jgi:phytol kinase
MIDIRAFAYGCIPSWQMAWLGGPVCLLWSTVCLALAAAAKRRWNLKTGYSRKLFHFLTFASAAALHFGGGLRLVCLFGAMTTLVLAYTVVRGAGHGFYEALARQGDAPYRTHYIVVSYVATLIGGLLSNLVAPSFALLGYLVCGLGDASGEPIGARWGRHWYSVPTRAGTSVKRSLEGSTGVFVVSALALSLGVAVLMGSERVLQAWGSILLIAAASTLVEALSPHGWDNASLQLTPAVLATLMLGT